MSLSATTASSTSNSPGKPKPNTTVTIPVEILPSNRTHGKDYFKDIKGFELDQLPPMFIPKPTLGRHRMPPVLRRGYPLTPEALLNLIKEAGYDELDAPPQLDTDAGIEALSTAEAVLSNRLQRAVKVHFVYGTPATNGCMFETCDNYSMKWAMSSEQEEQLRKEMLAEGAPKWYLDLSRDNWEWKNA